MLTAFTRPDLTKANQTQENILKKNTRKDETKPKHRKTQENTGIITSLAMKISRNSLVMDTKTTSQSGGQLTDTGGFVSF